MGGEFERSERLEHQTLGVQRLAVRSEDYWDFKPEQRVQTIDGVVGVVKHVQDGPVPGTEEYHVELEHGLGGGRYTASQLSPAPITTAAMEQTAAADYPELAQILVERPDPASLHVTAAQADDDDEDDDSDDADDSSDEEDDSDDSEGQDDSDDGDDDSDGDDAPPWVKSASKVFSDLVVMAATDSDFRFHVTAAWRDVVEKAKRIRSEGRLRVTLASDGMVFGEVKGDHEVYETGLQRMPGKMAAHAWSCGCKWGAYHWGAPDDFSRFAGRMCSHALALQYEAQSRGMFGRDVNVDEHKPAWVPRKVVVRYDIDADQHRLAPATAASKNSWNDYYPSDTNPHTDWDAVDAHRAANPGEMDHVHRGFPARIPWHDYLRAQEDSASVEERGKMLMDHVTQHMHNGGLGHHWTSSPQTARRFSGEKEPGGVGSDGWATAHLPVVVHAHWPEREHIETDPSILRSNKVFSHDEPEEREVPLKKGAPVHITGISWAHEHRSTNPGRWRWTTYHLGDGNETTHTASRTAPSASPLSVVARAAVAAGEDSQELLLALAAAGISPGQGELFDSSSYKVEKPKKQVSDREQYGDDEDGYRYHVDGRGNRFYPCFNKHCPEGGKHEDGESARAHQDVFTDWNTVHPTLPDTLHRGMALSLPDDVHSVVHDDHRPAVERAKALSEHLREEGLGTHWTPDHDQAKHYSGITDGRDKDTHVIMHVHTPSKRAIETDPDTLAEQDVISMGSHDDAEVPLRHGARVQLKGLSWRHRTDEKWTRHDFDRPVKHTANANAPFGEPSGTSYHLPKTPGATQKRRPWENPASAGPLAGADPVGWNRQLPLQSYANAGMDTALFEPGGTEAVLHDEPEPALPSTDGSVPTDEASDLTPSMTAGLRRQALKDFSLAEQQALINEGEGVRAANLDRLDITGTHYADLEQVLAAQEDDTTWLI
ncbi:hypothetical protein ACPCSE_29550 [Streptomyces cellulosae]